jgi:hypothetical protein
MSDNVITFPEPAGLFPKRRTIPVTSEPEQEEPKKGYWRSRENVRNGPNLQRLLFRSSHLIVESDEADLVRDVCFDVDRAQTKLKRIQLRLKGVQEQAAAQVQLLTAAETKLTAAIVAALLSTRGGNANA